MLRRGIWFAGEVTVPRMVELSRQAEQAGLDSVWMADGYYARDVMVSLGAIGAATSRVTLGTCILNPFTRHPAVLAMGFATLDEVTGGRAIVGIGAGARHHVESHMGYDASRPLTAVREAVDVMEKMAAGEELEYDGRVIKARGARLMVRGARQLPIYIGAVGPKMCRLAGARGAGVFVSHTAPDVVRANVKLVAEGAESAGRDPRDVDIACTLIMAVGESEEAAARIVAPLLALMLLAPEGERILEGNGFDPALAQRVRDGYAAGGLRQATPIVTPDLIETLTIAGTVDRCREKLQELVNAGITHPVVSMLGPAPEGAFEVLAAIEDPR